MFKENKDQIEITCDKCGTVRKLPKSIDYNKVLYVEWWTTSRRAKKYKHKCGSCLLPKERRAMGFVRDKFPSLMK